MSSSILPSEILGLPVAERLAIVEELWNSIVDEQGSFEMTDHQKREIDRRLKAREARQDTALPWEEVKNRLLGE